MIKSSLLTSIFLFLSCLTLLQGQSYYGYLGKKNIVAAQPAMSVSFFNPTNSGFYLNYKNNLSYSRILGKQFMLSLRLGGGSSPFTLKNYRWEANPGVSTPLIVSSDESTANIERTVLMGVSEIALEAKFYKKNWAPIGAFYGFGLSRLQTTVEGSQFSYVQRNREGSISTFPIRPEEDFRESTFKLSFISGYSRVFNDQIYFDLQLHFSIPISSPWSSIGLFSNRSESNTNPGFGPSDSGFFMITNEEGYETLEEKVLAQSQGKIWMQELFMTYLSIGYLF